MQYQIGAIIALDDYYAYLGDDALCFEEAFGIEPTKPGPSGRIAESNEDSALNSAFSNRSLASGHEVGGNRLLGIGSRCLHQARQWVLKS